MRVTKYFFTMIALMAMHMGFGQIILDDNQSEMYLCDNTPVTLLSPGQGMYGPGQLFIKTICSDIEPAALEFIAATFGHPADFLCVYDGSSTMDPVLFCFNESSTLTIGEVIRTTFANTTGCLTFQFSSDANSMGGSFEMELQCAPPCKLLAGLIDSTTPPLDPMDNVYVNLCPGDVMELNAFGLYDADTSFYTQADSLSEFIWFFGDGTSDTGKSVTHVYDAAQIYVLDLVVIDSAGCRSINEVNLRARQTPDPTILFTPNMPELCTGDSIELTGFIQGLTIGDTAFLDTITSQSSAVVVDTVFLPDDSDGISGNGITTPVIYPLEIFGYIPGTVLADINDLYSVCADIEHSYVGDIDIILQCPNGQSVALVDFSPPGTPGNFLGMPVDGDNGNPQEGVPFTYCWSPTSVAGSIAIGQPALANSPILADTYQAVGNWTNLINCPLNGTWNLIISDDFGSDNGFTFGASIDFNPQFLIEPDTFFVSYLNPLWDASPSLIGNLNDTSIIFSTTETENQTVVFNVDNNIGCTMTDSLEVKLNNPTIVMIGDTAICVGDTALIGYSIPAVVPDQCGLVIDMFDSFGDGWDGANIDILINGTVSQNITATGTGSSETISLAGGDTLTIIYNAGAFEGEHSYEIVDDRGVIIFSAGPNPPTGAVFTYTCPVVEVIPTDVFVYDTLCPFTFDMEDSFGDGWNGATLDVIEDGTTLASLTFTTGTQATEIVGLTVGSTLTIDFTSGGFPGEESYEVFDENGASIISAGPNPANGIVYTGLITYSPNCIISEPFPGVMTSWSPLTATDTATGSQYTQFVFPNQSTTYELTAVFSNGCTSVESVDVDIITFDYTLTPDTDICDGDDIQLNASGSDSYTWTTNNETLNDTSIANPIGSPLDDVVYYVELDSAGCVNIDSVAVVVNDLPISRINDDTDPIEFCEGTTVELFTDDMVGWNFAWTGAESGTGATIDVGTEGDYLLTVTDQNNCAFAITVTVDQLDSVVLDMVDIQNILCCMDTISVAPTDFIVSGNALTVSWDGTPVAGDFEISSLGTDGSETYDVEVEADNGCISTSSVEIETRCIEPSITAIDTIFAFTTDTFDLTHNMATGSTYEYAWTADPVTVGTFVDSTAQNGEFIAGPAIGVYNANVSVTGVYTLNNGTTINDCIEETTTQYEIVDISDPLYPDAFTPNADADNQYFIPRISQLSEITEFKVYNRWHQIVYSYKTGDQGWDGTLDGNEQPEDVYNYFIRITNQDGTEFTNQNTVTLIR